MDEGNSMITTKVRAYVMEETFADGGKVKDDTMVFREGYFDSMGFVRLVSFLESEFGIKISDEDLVESNFESINAISNFVSNRAKLS
jgi:acyl carrier protein